MAGTLSRDSLASGLIGRWRTTRLELRRGATALAAQEARVRVATGTPSVRRTDGAGESRGRAVVWGAAAMDIARDDRFTVEGVAYRVTYVRPDRTVATWADCEVAQ